MPWLVPIAVGLGAAGIGAAMGSGKKPKVPQYKRTDPSVEQDLAIQNNAKNLPQAQQLAQATNFFNQAELDRMLSHAIPGYAGKVAKESENIDSFLRGELPADVVTQIKRHSAEKAIGGGFGGGGMARNMTARDLGLTSLDLTKFGTQLSPVWMAGRKATGMARPFDPASMFLTPGQRIATEQSNNQGQYGRDLYQAQVAAAPNPFMANMGGILGNIGGAAMNYGMQNIFGGLPT